MRRERVPGIHDFSGVCKRERGMARVHARAMTTESSC